MGAGHSKPEMQARVFHTETPVEFSRDVVHHLSDRLASAETTPERQTTLHDHIRSRIQSELQILRAEEEKVQREIQHALEKENLDHEISSSENGDIRHTSALIGDLEEIRARVDHFQTRRQLSDLPFVKETGDAVVACYKSNATRPLDCWRQVTQFKAAVADAETKYLTSLR
ncbi:hypothetical protein F5I97DRAFT_1934650 [Phlebopus sp. FC_14]|nr:hypothetical protein F5I97DRAFT_1934650 [Phlebopus sp. FC_14]